MTRDVFYNVDQFMCDDYWHMELVLIKTPSNS